MRTSKKRFLFFLLSSFSWNVLGEELAASDDAADCYRINQGERQESSLKSYDSTREQGESGEESETR